jgi:hypothetical protein
MALYQHGDYSPRTPLHVVNGDSSRWQVVDWTDARHIPLYPNETPFLADSDRPANNFGLSVRTTYYLPQAKPDVMFVRFDVSNVSDSAAYRLVHREEPAGGHTMTDIYLAPIVDAEIGHPLSTGVEATDDNATMFPAESLLVAYDEAFNVSTFTTTWQTKPGLVGLELLDGPPGTTARGILFNGTLDPTYLTAAQEDTAYRLILAGRAALPFGCVDRTVALVCSSESGNEIRMGWSVGPIASLAPGETVTLTVALLIAEPVAGAYTNGQNVAPQNDQLASTTRQIYAIAGNVRTLAAGAKGTTVNPTR